MSAGVVTGAHGLEIKIEVSAAGGGEVHKPYVAIATAETGSWDTPLREMILDRNRVTIDLTPGAYRILVGAPDFATVESEIAVDRATELPVVLSPANSVGAYVVDGAGQPVSGATVRRLGMPRLSPTGRQYLRENFESTTNERGYFEVSTGTQKDTRYVVEAHRFQPAVVDLKRPEAASVDVIRLAAGAVLRVRGNSSLASAEGAISLLPVDVPLPPDLSRTQAIAMWTRPVANAAAFQWPSLFPGTYRLIHRPGTPGDATTALLELGEIVLAPGEDRTVSVEIPPQNTVRAAKIPVRVFVPDTASDTEFSVGVWHHGERTAVVPNITAANGGSMLSFQTGTVAGAMVVVSSPTATGAARLSDMVAGTVRVPLRGHAYVSATIVAPTGSKRHLWGTVAACDGTSETVDLPFATSDGRIRIALPAGCASGVLRIAGFVPARVALPQLRAGQQHDVGTIRLQQGAAAVVRVVRAHDGEPIANVRVTAVRSHELRAQRSKWDLSALELGGASTDATGWVRLAGLPAESISFVLSAPGRTLPQISEPFRLPQHEETVIDDLTLGPPSRVLATILLNAATDRFVELQSIELTPTGHNHWPARDALRAWIENGHAMIDNVPPGSWAVHAIGRVRDGFAVALGSATVDVRPGEDHHVALTIDDLLYHGRVTRAGLPVSGTINLKSADTRAPIRSAVARLGSDGDFVVMLERKGKYVLSLQDRSGGGLTLAEPISFDDPGEEMLIRLPAAAIEGRVVDEQGVPMGGVSVSATRQFVETRAVVYTRTAADGLFRLEGVTTGTWEMLAESPRGRSRPVAVALDRNDLDGLALVIEPTRGVTVKVVDSTGAPLRRTLIVMHLAAPGQHEPMQYAKRTTETGEAVFTVPAAPPPAVANLVIATPEGNLSCARIGLDRNQVVSAPAQMGEAQLIRKQWADIAGRHWLVSDRGCAVPLMAERQQSGTGEAMVFSRLAVGQWSYVATHAPAELAAVLTGQAGMVRAYATFRVEAGKTTRVTLDRSP